MNLGVSSQQKFNWHCHTAEIVYKHTHIFWIKFLSYILVKHYSFISAAYHSTVVLICLSIFLVPL